jgi:hypothetical protein
VNVARERFAERLALDLQRVFGIGIAIEGSTGPEEDGESTRVAASILFDGRIETLEAWAPNEELLYWLVMSRAVELLRVDAFSGLAGPI